MKYKKFLYLVDDYSKVGVTLSFCIKFNIYSISNLLIKVTNEPFMETQSLKQGKVQDLENTAPEFISSSECNVIP